MELRTVLTLLGMAAAAAAAVGVLAGREPASDGPDAADNGEIHDDD